MLWSSKIWTQYDPSYCYGHGEPTQSYISTDAGSGEDASFRMTLPADGPSFSQGDFYATIWFGGTVYDPNSTQGDGQGFLEFQFYPAPPEFTGANSGAQDCASDGSFSYIFSPGSNDWFACVIVWQLQQVENAAIADPLDLAGSSDAIMEMHSGDRVYVNYSGVAQSSTQGWKLSVNDTTAASSGSVTLVNGGLVLSPYYSTAAPGNGLLWGASNPGAIAFAYEIGHALNASIPQNNGYGGCSPGDGVCDSYWPGRWSKMGEMKLELPLLGSPNSQMYPSRVVFSSSQGGEAEINASTSTSSSTCPAPSFSNSTNCMYPYYQYRSDSYSFTYGATSVANATYTYGNEYQFPATFNGAGQWNGNSEPAPWGTFQTTVSPLTASVEFNRVGEVNPLSVAPNGSAGAQFEEGPYWFNDSAPGCTGVSAPVYVKTGAQDRISGALSCGGNPPLSASVVPSVTSGVIPLTVLFAGSGTGGTSSYSYNWTFGDGTTSTSQNPTHVYSSAGTYAATLTVTDSHGTTAAAGATIRASPPLRAIASGNPTTGVAPLLVNFTGSESGGTPVYQYSWTFGDGGTSAVQSPSHTYSSAGDYTATLTVKDSTSATNSSSVAIQVTAVPEYNIQFNETGLAPGTNWSVNVTGTVHSGATPTLSFLLPDGTFPYSVRAANATFRGDPNHGTVVVAGTDETVNVTFVNVTYDLTFSETGLPAGRSWSVQIGGSNQNSISSSITFVVTNGTYPYSVGGPSGYIVSPASGSVLVRGTNQTVSIHFSLQQFVLAFEAQGLPAAANWTVSLNQTSLSTRGPWHNFTLVPGAYVFTIRAPDGFSASPSQGSENVSNARVTVLILFAPVTYPVTFEESGLVQGTPWEIVAGAQPYDSATSSITIQLPNGSTPYSVGNVTGYSTVNRTGIIDVAGHPVTVPITYTARSPGTSVGLSSGWVWLIAIAAIGCVVAGGVIYAEGASRRRQSSR